MVCSKLDGGLIQLSIAAGCWTQGLNVDCTRATLWIPKCLIMYMLRKKPPKPITKNSKKNCRSLTGNGLEGLVLITPGSFPSSNLDCIVLLFPLSNSGSWYSWAFFTHNQILKSSFFHGKTGSTKSNITYRLILYSTTWGVWMNQNPHQKTDQNTKQSLRSQPSHQTTTENQLLIFKTRKLWTKIKTLLPCFGKGKKNKEWSPEKGKNRVYDGCWGMAKSKLYVCIYTEFNNVWGRKWWDPFHAFHLCSWIVPDFNGSVSFAISLFPNSPLMNHTA